MNSTVVTLVTLLLLAACGPVGQESDASDEQAGAELWGRSFTSVTVRDERSDAQPDEVAVAFEDRESGGIVRWSGCNATGSEVEVTADRLRLQGGPTDSTLVGCPPDEEETDQWLLRFFGGDPRWELDDDQLVLTSGNGSAVIVLEPSGDGVERRTEPDPSA